MAASEARGLSPTWLQEQRRYIQAWRQALNAKPRASLRSKSLPWRVRAILEGQRSVRAWLAVLCSFLAFLVARGDLRADENHLEGLELSFFERRNHRSG